MAREIIKSGKHKKGEKRKSGKHKAGRVRSEAAKVKEAARRKKRGEHVLALENRVRELELQLQAASADSAGPAASAGSAKRRACPNCSAMAKQINWLQNALKDADKEILNERNMRLRMEVEAPKAARTFVRSR